MNKIAVALALLVSLVAPAAASAAEGPLMVRLRGVYVLTADKSEAVGALGVPSDKISVQSKLIPEVDLSWFFTPNLAAELILTYPQEHDVKVNFGGVGKIGTVTELPPCLTAQWHFLPGGMVNPYVGAGVNLTLYTAHKLNVAGLKLDVDSSSVGFVGQVGADVKVADRLYVNADVKYVNPFGTDVKYNGTKVTHVDVNPWLFAVGLGYRFL